MMNILDNSVGPSVKTLKGAIMYWRDIQPHFGHRTEDPSTCYATYGAGHPHFWLLPLTLIDLEIRSTGTSDLTKLVFCFVFKLITK